MNLNQMLTLILAIFVSSARSYSCKEVWHDEFDCAENCGCGWCKSSNICLNGGSAGPSNSSINDGLTCSVDEFVIAMRCSSRPWNREDTIILISVLGSILFLLSSVTLAYWIYRKRCRSPSYTSIA